MLKEKKFLVPFPILIVAADFCADQKFDLEIGVTVLEVDCGQRAREKALMILALGRDVNIQD